MAYKPAAPALGLLPLQTREQLRTGVSLTSLPQALVEVVSNSLDARATAISVTLKLVEQGFQVDDDGIGIAASQLPLVGTRYSSSKRAGTTQLGYRGEALSSIAEVARLHVISRAVGSFETFERVVVGGVQLRSGPCAPLRFERLTATRGTRVEVLQFMRCGPQASAQGSGPQGGRRTANTIKAAQDRNTEQLQEACLHQVLLTALPYTEVQVQIWNPQGKLLLDMSKGRSLPSWAVRILRPSAQPDRGGAQGVRWLEEVEEHIPSAGSSTTDLHSRYRIQGIVLGPDCIRLAPDAQMVYINKRRINLPSELQAMVNTWFNAAVARAAAAGTLLQGAAGSAAAAAGSSRLGTLGPCFPAYVLVIECPTADVMVDGVIDKSSVTLSRPQTVKTLLARILQRAWGSSGAVASGAKDAIAHTAPALAPASRNAPDVGAGIAAVQPQVRPAVAPAPLADSATAAASQDRRSGGTKRKLEMQGTVAGAVKQSGGSGAQAEQRCSGRAVEALQPSLLHPTSRTRSLASTHPNATGTADHPPSGGMGSWDGVDKHPGRVIPAQASKPGVGGSCSGVQRSTQHPIVQAAQRDAPMFVRNPGMMQSSALRPMLRWLHNSNHAVPGHQVSAGGPGINSCQVPMETDEDDLGWSMGTPPDADPLAVLQQRAQGGRPLGMTQQVPQGGWQPVQQQHQHQQHPHPHPHQHPHQQHQQHLHQHQQPQTHQQHHKKEQQAATAQMQTLHRMRPVVQWGQAEEAAIPTSPLAALCGLTAPALSNEAAVPHGPMQPLLPSPSPIRLRSHRTTVDASLQVDNGTAQQFEPPHVQHLSWLRMDQDQDQDPDLDPDHMGQDQENMDPTDHTPGVMYPHTRAKVSLQLQDVQMGGVGDLGAEDLLMQQYDQQTRGGQMQWQGMGSGYYGAWPDTLEGVPEGSGLETPLSSLSHRGPAKQFTGALQSSSRQAFSMADAMIGPMGPSMWHTCLSSADDDHMGTAGGSRAHAGPRWQQQTENAAHLLPLLWGQEQGSGFSTQDPAALAQWAQQAMESEEEGDSHEGEGLFRTPNNDQVTLNGHTHWGLHSVQQHEDGAQHGMDFGMPFPSDSSPELALPSDLWRQRSSEGQPQQQALLLHRDQSSGGGGVGRGVSSQRMSAPASLLAGRGVLRRLATQVPSDSDISEEEVPSHHPRPDPVQTLEMPPFLQHLPQLQRLPSLQLQPLQPLAPLPPLQPLQPTTCAMQGQAVPSWQLHGIHPLACPPSSESLGSLGGDDEWRRVPSAQHQQQVLQRPTQQSAVSHRGRNCTGALWSTTPKPEPSISASQQLHVSQDSPSRHQQDTGGGVLGIVPPLRPGLLPLQQSHQLRQQQAHFSQRTHHKPPRQNARYQGVDLHAALVLIRAMPEAMTPVRRTRRAASAPPAGAGHRSGSLLLAPKISNRKDAARSVVMRGASGGLCKSLGAVRLSGYTAACRVAIRKEGVHTVQLQTRNRSSVTTVNGEPAHPQLYASQPPLPPTTTAPPPPTAPVLASRAPHTTAAGPPPVRDDPFHHNNAAPVAAATATTAPPQSPALPTHPPAPSTTLVEAVLRNWVNPVTAQRKALTSRTVLAIEQLQQRGGGAGVGAAARLVPTSVTRSDMQGARMLNQVDRRFIVVISRSGTLLCVDQHAAHERVRLELLTTQLLTALQSTVPAAPPGPVAQPTPEASSMQHARRGNAAFAGHAPVALGKQPVGGGAAPRAAAATTLVPSAQQPQEGPAAGAQSAAHKGGSSSSTGGAAISTGVPLELSSSELRAWYVHQHTIRHWGWDLQEAHRPAPTSGAAAAAGPVVVQAMAGVSGKAMALIHVPVVFGTPLTAADLKAFLHQLGTMPAAGSSVEAGGAPAGSTAAPPASSTTASGAALGGRGLMKPQGDAAAGGTTGRLDPKPAGNSSGTHRGGSGTPSSTQGGSVGGVLPPGALRVLRSRACRTAIMFGDALLASECEELVRLLAACDLWHSCAHGRPTVAPLVHLPSIHTALTATAAAQQYAGRAHALTSPIVLPAGSGPDACGAIISAVAPSGVRDWVSEAPAPRRVLTAVRLRELLRKHRPCPRSPDS